MKSVLIIGGGGYIGTVLTSYLLEKKYKVTVLDNFLYQNQFAIQPYLQNSDYIFIPGDLGNTADLENASHGITDVVILGGLVGDPITKSYPEASSAINDVGIRTCIDFFRNKSLDKLIFVSTCSNYGMLNENEIADENFELNPLSLYAKDKVNAEQFLLKQKNEVNYTGVVLRFATAFGISPRMRFDLSVNEFTRQLFFGKELLIFDEYTWRPYCHVLDFARLIEIVLTAQKEKVYFEVFNAGGNFNNLTKKMIVDEIIKHVPEGKVKFVSNGNDPRNYKVSFNKVRRILGFKPELTVEDGIKEIVRAFEMGIYIDSFVQKNKYGNYEINYPLK